MTSQSTNSREWAGAAESSTDASNAETSSTVEWLGSVNDYLFGKAFFEFHMLRDAFFGDSPTSVLEYPVDAKATLAAVRFPYMECLQSMEDATDISSSDGQSAQDSRFSLMNLIGKSFRLRGVAAERLISSTLDGHMNRIESVTNSSPGSPPSRADPPNVLGVTDSEEDPSDYTMRWKEYLDGLQMRMDIEETNVHRNPPLWKATIVYGSHTFEGSGTSKKLAKHRVTRKACEALNIP